MFLINRSKILNAHFIFKAVARSQQIQELNRFLHYYTRFKNHEHSRKLEESLLTAVKHKMEVLASSLASRKGEKFCSILLMFISLYYTSLLTFKSISGNV